MLRELYWASYFTTPENRSQCIGKQQLPLLLPLGSVWSSPIFPYTQTLMRTGAEKKRSTRYGLEDPPPPYGCRYELCSGPSLIPVVNLPLLFVFLFLLLLYGQPSCSSHKGSPLPGFPTWSLYFSFYSYQNNKNRFAKKKKNKEIVLWELCIWWKWNKPLLPFLLLTVSFLGEGKTKIPSMSLQQDEYCIWPKTSKEWL